MKLNNRFAVATASLVLATSLSASNVYAFPGKSLAVGAVAEVLLKTGGKFATQVGCATGGITAQNFKLVQKFKANTLSAGEESEFEAAVANGLCIDGKLNITQIVEFTGDVTIAEKACVSVASAGRVAGCNHH